MDGSRGLSGRELSIQEAERREHNRLELERIRRQREEREILSKKKLEEKEKAVMERERENLGDWEEKERIFHLSQAYQKVYVRVRESRARNLHLLALVTLRIPLLIGKEVLKDEEIFLLSDESISEVLNKIDYDQLNDALDELEDLFIPYEDDKKILEFWDSFKFLIDQIKKKLRENRNISIVKDEVNAIFNDKSVIKLLELREGIEKKLKGPNVDTDYWSGLLTELDQVIFKRRLDDLYDELKKRLVNDAKSRGLKIISCSFSQFKNGEIKFISKYNNNNNNNNVKDETVAIAKEQANEQNTFVEQSNNNNNNNNNNIIIDTSNVYLDNCQSALYLLEQEQTRHVGKDELPFNTEAEDLLTQESTLPLWQSKYQNIKGIKPRFFNRVRMNYVWNKYNQTHYDTSNPPPKIVQGFRFNIFYPDLLFNNNNNNNTKNAVYSVPNYKREPDPTSPDNEILRFTAGPPYTDVIFRIPKEEWDMSSQHGFKCVFERGALRLHFWFRSQRYRR